MTKLLTTLLFILPGYLSSAQTYHPFLYNQTDWYESVNNFGINKSYWYHRTNDSLINGINYSTIETSEVPPVFFYLREDTINKIVYQITPPDSTVRILYNYNLAIGDTYIMHLPGIGNLVALVDTIDTLSTSIGNRKYYQLIQASTGYFIGSYFEELGSIIEPFRFLLHGTDPVMFLACRYDDTLQTYRSTGWNCGPNPYTTGMHEISNQFNDIIIYPDPAQNICNVRAPSFSDAWITIYNIDGRLMNRQTFNFYEMINILNLKEGFYYIKLEDKKGRSLVKKLVKN